MEQDRIELQGFMLSEFNKTKKVTPFPFNYDSTSFNLSSNTSNKHIRVTLTNLSAEAKLIFLGLKVASSFKEEPGRSSSLSNLYNVAPKFVEFINQYEFTDQNRILVLKEFEAIRVKQDKVKTQSSGFEIIKGALEFSLRIHEFLKELTAEQYDYLSRLCKDKAAAPDPVEQKNMPEWFGFHSWLRKDEYMGNEAFEMLASPKLAIDSLRTSFASALKHLSRVRENLADELLSQGFDDTLLCDFPAKPLRKDYTLEEYKTLRSPYLKTMEKLKEELYYGLRDLLRNSKDKELTRIGLSLHIYAALPPKGFQLLSRLDRGKNENTQLFGTSDENVSLLFTRNFIRDLLNARKSGEPLPISKLERWLFGYLMSSFCIPTDDIFRLQYKDFNFKRIQNGSLKAICCKYFKTRADKVHTSDMIKGNSLLGRAVYDYLENSYSMNMSKLVDLRKAEFKLKTGKGSVGARIMLSLKIPELFRLIEVDLKAEGHTSIVLDALAFIADFGIRKEAWRSISGGLWEADCETPCSARWIALQPIKNSAVHANSNSFDPATIWNSNSHSNETERNNYLNIYNSEWMGNTARVTRLIMSDIANNIMRPSKSEYRFNGETLKRSAQLIMTKRSEVLNRVKMVSEAKSGDVDELGFLNRYKEDDMPVNTMYLVNSKETVMRFKHFLAEIEKKYTYLLNRAPEYLFNTALPTAEWMENLLVKGHFSTQTLEEGEVMYRKYKSVLPPLFSVQTGGINV